jgi:hypothetical protein
MAGCLLQFFGCGIKVEARTMRSSFTRFLIAPEAAVDSSISGAGFDFGFAIRFLRALSVSLYRQRSEGGVPLTDQLKFFLEKILIFCRVVSSTLYPSEHREHGGVWMTGPPFGDHHEFGGREILLLNGWPLAVERPQRADEIPMLRTAAALLGSSLTFGRHGAGAATHTTWSRRVVHATAEA